MIAGVSVEVGNEAVVVRSSAPLRVLSPAVHLGIAVTSRGPAARFGGPASEMGWVVARAMRVALDRAIADWQEHHR
jgi:hypothetical protein